VGLGIGTGLGPSVAQAASSTAGAVDHRVDAIKNALAGLVKDGTLSQSQADKVASTLDKALPEHFGRRHRGAEGMVGGPAVDAAAAKALGITVPQLRTELESGKTLA
jgi:hypothetical protein